MSAKVDAALNSYSDYGYNSEIEYADPHRLIQMLFEGALKRIAFAKGAMQRKQITEKGKFISQTIEIVGGLRASLDFENGGEIAANLESLYDYINRRLVTANLKNSEEMLDEVSSLLLDVKTAWDEINPATNPAQVTTQAEAEEQAPPVEASVETKTEPQAKQAVATPAVKPVNTRANKAIKAYSS